MQQNSKSSLHLGCALYVQNFISLRDSPCSSQTCIKYLFMFWHRRVGKRKDTKDIIMDMSRLGHHPLWCLKVHSMRYFWIFFWPKSNPYVPLVNFRKKFRLVSFDFLQNFEVRTFTRWLSIRETKFFLSDIQKFFFFLIFTMVLLDRFPDGFSKFRFFIVEISF